jgi:cysteine desulfurase
VANPRSADRSGSPPGRAILDAAPSPLHPQARETLLAAIDAGWADPRRRYAEARTARHLLDQAREVVAHGLGVRPAELTFHPSGPAAVRAALDGVSYAGRRRGDRIVASAVEHSAVLDYAHHRTSRDDDARAAGAVPVAAGNSVEVGVDQWGRVDLDALAKLVAEPGTVLAAVQHANGEVGTVQPLAAAHAVCEAAGVPMVVDAQASLGRVPPPTAYDVLAGDASSWGGPGGLGVLVVPERVRFRRPGPRSEHEHGHALTTPWVPLALAAAEAWQQTEAGREADAAEASRLVDRIRACAATLADVEVVGDPDERLPHVVTFSVLYADGEALVLELDRRGIAVASGSACTASALTPSHVLAAMGVLTHGNVRVTLPLASVSPGRGQDVERLCAVLPEAVASVRAQLGARGL